jgi:hypothetical protein
MERKAVSTISEIMMVLIIVALVCSHEKELVIIHEHIPEMPYEGPNYSLRPPITVATTSATFTIPWKKM